MGHKSLLLNHWLFIETGKGKLLTTAKYQPGSSQYTINQAHDHTDGPSWIPLGHKTIDKNSREMCGEEGLHKGDREVGDERG